MMSNCGPAFSELAGSSVNFEILFHDLLKIRSSDGILGLACKIDWSRGFRIHWYCLKTLSVVNCVLPAIWTSTY